MLEVTLALAYGQLRKKDRERSYGTSINLRINWFFHEDLISFFIWNIVRAHIHVWAYFMYVTVHFTVYFTYNCAIYYESIAMLQKIYLKYNFCAYEKNFIRSDLQFFIVLCFGHLQRNAYWLLRWHHNVTYFVKLNFKPLFNYIAATEKINYSRIIAKILQDFVFKSKFWQNYANQAKNLGKSLETISFLPNLFSGGGL